MAALFAACVNDDFETISKQQNAASDGRPTVSDVKLEFAQAEDPATRVIFDGKYHWQSNDTIGALLMDNVITLDENSSWLEKYGLVGYIHTSYPFTYNSTEDTWGCNTKMLEGNYFFAYPWESYDGQRQVTHSLLNQSQEGIGANVVAESYAKNQFFIGYSRIMAGAEAKDVLNTVEMVSTLGAIQLRITNTGTQTYHINKVVLSGHDDVASVLTFDPTDAQYGTTTDADKWNLQGASYKNFFNYANYEGEESENELYKFGVAATPSDYVYNIESGDEYERNAALRAVVKEYPSTEQSAQLIINGSADERALRPHAANTAYVLIMCNPLEIGTARGTDQLLLSIYTDEGFVQNIDLAEIHAESADYSVVTDSKIEEVSPSKSNTIGIQIDDNSFIVPDKMDIYNSSDLLQFVKWNTTVVGERKATATLKQDVTFTAEILEALKANKNTSVTIDGTNELTLAEDVPANVLDDKQLTISTPVVIEGSVALTEESDDVKSIEVAEGATLTINDGKANVPATITNNGTLNIGAEASLKAATTIANYGTIEAAKGSDSRANITNNKEAVINNNGYMLNVTNQKDAVINMGEDATLSVDNAGKVVTADGATVNGTNTGEIVYVNGAVINATGGTISTEYTAGTLNAAAVKALTDNHVNKVILTGSTTVTEDVTIAGVEVADGGELLVNNNMTLTATDVTVSGNATVGGQGTLAAVIMEVKEEASLTVANTATITVSTSFTNDGMVYNNGTVAIPGGEANQGNGWRYNNAVDSSEPTTVSTMKVAVVNWIEEATTTAGGIYYAYNPNDITKFIASMNTWLTSSGDSYGAKALAKAWGSNGQALTTFTGMDKNTSFVAAFNSAVQSEVLNQTNVAAATLLVINATNSTINSSYVPDQDATLYATEAAANAALQLGVATKAYTEGNELRAAAVYGIANLETYLANTTNPTTAPYTYIWKGCPLDEVMSTYRLLTIGDWDAKLNETPKKWKIEVDADGNDGGLKVWMRAVLDATNTNDSYVNEAKTVVNKYITEYMDWEYSLAQIKNAGK